MPRTQFTCSVITKRGSSMDTLSRLLVTTGSGAPGIPTREVKSCGPILFNKIRSFILSVSESKILKNDNPDVYDLEFPLRNQYAEDYATEMFNTGYKISPYMSSSKTVSMSYGYTGSILATHIPSLYTSSNGTFYTYPTESYSLTTVDLYGDETNPLLDDPLNHIQSLQSQSVGIFFNPRHSFQNTKAMPAFAFPISAVNDPLLVERFDQYAASSSNYTNWLHSLKEIDHLYSGSLGTSSHLRFGGEFLITNFFNMDFGNGRTDQQAPWYPDANFSNDPYTYNSKIKTSGSVWDLNKRHKYYSGSVGISNPLGASGPRHSYGDLSLIKRPIESYNPLHEHSYSYHLTGKGTRFLNSERACYETPDFYDFKGRSRMKFINFIRESSSSINDWPHSRVANAYHKMGLTRSTNNSGDGGNKRMGQHANLSTHPAVGLLSGFATEAKIANFPHGEKSSAGEMPYYRMFELLAKVKDNQPINSDGTKEPIVLQRSVGSGTGVAPLPYVRTGSKATGHFSYPTSSGGHGHLKGIRINYLNKDYCFISCSVNAATSGQTILTGSKIDVDQEFGTPNSWANTFYGNGLPITPDLTSDNTYREIINGVTSSLDIAINGRKCRSNFYFYTGSISDLVNTINRIHTSNFPNVNAVNGDEVFVNDRDNISGSFLWNYWGFKGMFHVTASHDGDTLILSSSRETYGDIKVFTGSAEQFLGHQANPLYQRYATYSGNGIGGAYSFRVNIDFTPTAPYGGAHQLTLKPHLLNATCSSGIREIGYRGNNIGAQARLDLHSSNHSKEIWLQARYGYNKFHDHDHFGINNGWNELGPPMPDYQNHKAYGIYSNAKIHGIGTAFLKGDNDIFYWPSKIQSDPNYATVDGQLYGVRSRFEDPSVTENVVFQQAAERGVIIVNSTGNSGNLCTQTGSSTEDIYFDSSFYNTLAENNVVYKPNVEDGYFYYCFHPPQLGARGNQWGYIDDNGDFVGSLFFGQGGTGGGNNIANIPNVTNTESAYTATFTAHGHIDANDYPDNIQSHAQYTSRMHVYNGSMIYVGGLTTSHTMANERNEMGNCDLRGYHDASHLVDGPGNLGYGRIFPSLTINQYYNCGPGVDTYAAHSYLRYPAHSGAGLEYEDEQDGDLNFLTARTHSIYQSIINREGAPSDSGSGTYNINIYDDICNSLNIPFEGTTPSGVPHGGNALSSSAMSNLTIVNNYDVLPYNSFNEVAFGVIQLTGSINMVKRESEHKMNYHYGFAGQNGGTSTSGPVATGAILLYMQINPSATVLDVRRFLKYHNKKILRDIGGANSNPTYQNHLTASSLNLSDPQNSDPRYSNLLDGAVSGSTKLGGRGHNGLLHFPFNSGFKRRYSGSLSIRKK